MADAESRRPEHTRPSRDHRRLHRSRSERAMARRKAGASSRRPARSEECKACWMKTCRVHIMGASGAGVTSLGRALADALAVPHHDTDDYFWRPTTPPYREQREIAERLRLMREIFLPRADWVLSGSLEGWGDPIVAHFDLVVFLTTPKGLRVQRL